MSYFARSPTFFIGRNSNSGASGNGVAAPAPTRSSARLKAAAASAAASAAAAAAAAPPAAAARQGVKKEKRQRKEKRERKKAKRQLNVMKTGEEHQAVLPELMARVVTTPEFEALLDAVSVTEEEIAEEMAVLETLGGTEVITSLFHQST